MNEPLEKAGSEELAELARFGATTAEALRNRVERLQTQLSDLRTKSIEVPMGCSLLFVERNEDGGVVVFNLSGRSFETGGVDSLLSPESPSLRPHVMFAHLRNAISIIEDVVERKRGSR